MLKIKVLFVSLVVLSSMANAQTWKYMRQEFHAGIGASSFFGDLGGAKGLAKHDIRDIRASATRPALQLGYKYMIRPVVSVKALFTTAYLSGDDASTKNLNRQNRNLSFRAGIWELDGLIEIFPFSERVTKRYKIRGIGGKSTFSVSPYFNFGIGIVAYQPKAKLDGTWHALQPLATEGQGLGGRPDKYKRYTYSIPVGIGVKYLVDRNWSFGFELSLRYTGSDYIDDVSTSYYTPSELEASYGPISPQLSNRGLDQSLGETGVIESPNGTNNYLQRGDPRWNDAYSFAIFTVHYRLRRGTKFIPKF